MIGFVGLSHLGLNYSLATAAKGFDVVAYDPDAMSRRDAPLENFPSRSRVSAICSLNIALGSVTHRMKRRWPSANLFFIRSMYAPTTATKATPALSPHSSARPRQSFHRARSQSFSARLRLVTRGSSGRNSARFRPPTSTTRSRR